MLLREPFQKDPAPGQDGRQLHGCAALRAENQRRGKQQTPRGSRGTAPVFWSAAICSPQPCQQHSPSSHGHTGQGTRGWTLVGVLLSNP